MTAEATKAKEITVTFNKPIADASKVKATVKKGSADRACKATVDGSKIILAMDAKLIKGTYTVTVEGVADTAMTADVVVAKDEELTSYKVSSVATMQRDSADKSKAATDAAIVTYEALNQYGERMSASAPQISCTLGTVANVKASTVNAAGSFEVNKIPAVMAVAGTKGTVVIVDRTNGVNATQEVTVSAAATPTTVEVAGVYNANTNKIEELQANANLNSGNYYILFTAKDQYDEAFTDSTVFQAITSVSIASGLTNVALVTSVGGNNKAVISSRTVDGKDYLAVQLRAASTTNGATAKAGTYNLTVVNQEKGMILNDNFTVAEATVIKSIAVSADNGLYLGAKEQELTYEIIDQNGNAVTSYAVLNNSSLVDFNNTYGTFKFVKKADGSAKLVYTPDKDKISVVGNDDKKSAIITETVQLNEKASANFMVQPLTFTVYDSKIAKSVSKLKDGTVTNLAIGGAPLEISLGDIVYADQYGNEMSASDAKMDKFEIDEDAKVVSQSAVVSSYQDKTSYFVAQHGVRVSENRTDNKLKFSIETVSASSYAVVYLKYGQKASPSNYDFKFTVTASDTTGIDASTLKIKSINGGNAYHVTPDKAVAFDENIYNTDDNKSSKLSNIEVVGKIGGIDTIIPTSQYVIKSLKDNKISSDEANGRNGVKKTTTKTATVVVQVTTQDANGTRTETELTGTFVISTDAEKIAKVKGVQPAKDNNGAPIITSIDHGAVSAGALKALFTYKDQYDGDETYVDESTSGSGNILVAVDVYELPSGVSADKCKIVGSGTKAPQVTLAQPGVYTLSVKAYTVDADGKETSAKDCKIEVTVTNTTTTLRILD